MTPDELLASWVEKIKRIENETAYVFHNRKVFRAAQKMFQTNEGLQGSDAGMTWVWLGQMYGRDTVMAVRRELDNQAGVINLIHLLYEMENNAAMLTRKRHEEFYSHSTWFPRELMDDHFQRLGGPAGPGHEEDHVDPAAICEDRKTLQERTAKVLAHAQRLVAHRTLVDEIELNLGEIDQALGAIFECLRKYLALLTGADLAGATPVPQYDWLAAFRVAWLPKGYEPPTDQFDP